MESRQGYQNVLRDNVPRNRHEIAEEIVAQFLERVRRNHLRAADADQRITVRRSGRADRHAERASGAGPIVYDQRLAQCFSQRRPDDTDVGVDRAASLLRDHHANWPVWVDRRSFRGGGELYKQQTCRRQGVTGYENEVTQVCLLRLQPRLAKQRARHLCEVLEMPIFRLYGICSKNIDFLYCR